MHWGVIDRDDTEGRGYFKIRIVLRYGGVSCQCITEADLSSKEHRSHNRAHLLIENGKWLEHITSKLQGDFRDSRGSTVEKQISFMYDSYHDFMDKDYEILKSLDSYNIGAVYASYIVPDIVSGW